MTSIEEELGLALANFSYILELASENIIRQAKTKISDILEGKNETISKQVETINRLEESKMEILAEKEQFQNILQSLKDTKEQLKLL